MPPGQSKGQTATHRLLQRAHSPTSASRIYEEKIQHKPLQLLPNTTDARTERQKRRKAAAQARSRKPKSKPRPLSAKERRKYCVHDIPEEEVRYELYLGLHKLWCGYIREILGISAGERNGGGQGPIYFTPQAAGPMIASADFHGAVVEAVRSSCVERVGLKGVVVKDTKFTFVIVTKNNKLRTMPKEGTIFQIQIPLIDPNAASREAETEKRLLDDDTEVASTERMTRNLIFELQGSQFENRAPDRANKKFKMHVAKDI